MNRALFFFAALTFLIGMHASAPWPATALKASQAGNDSAEKSLLHPGFWEPPLFDAPYGPAWGLTLAEIKAIHGRLGAVTEILRKSPILKSPIGFQVRVYHTVGGSRGAPRDARQRLPMSRVSVFLFKYLRECTSCAIKPEVESSGHVYLTFNDVDELFPSPQKPFATDDQGPIYVGASRVGDFGRFPVYQSPGKGRKFVLTNSISNPLWLPVNQERYIRAEIAAARKTLESYTARGRSNPYQIKRIEILEEELNSLSASERIADAYIGDYTTRPSHLAAGKSATAQALVAPNTAFYNRRSTRISLQVLVVSTYPAVLNPSTFMGRTVQGVIDSVDWDAVARLLD